MIDIAACMNRRSSGVVASPASTLRGVGQPEGASRLGFAIVRCASRVFAIWMALACTSEAKQANRPLFASDAALAVTLQAPWSEIEKKTKGSFRRPAVLSYTDAQGLSHRIAANVETRGITRLRLCPFPPLRLRFARAAVAGTVFEGQKSLKLVTHCSPGQVWEQYYLQEMLAYRIYNLVTNHSFRVRALDITYQNVSGKKSNGPHLAFMIEDVDDMARRNGRKPSPQATFTPRAFDAVELSRFMLFQYLIGNTDWEVLSGPQEDECCHNVRVTHAAASNGAISNGANSNGMNSNGMIAVPYDFDSSGMVDAQYAGPHQSLPIKQVTQRLFRGFCRHNDSLETVRREFLGHRRAIFGLLENESHLNPRRRRTVSHYFEAFYLTLESEARFAREISGKCRK